MLPIAINNSTLDMCLPITHVHGVIICNYPTSTHWIPIDTTTTNPAAKIPMFQESLRATGHWVVLSVASSGLVSMVKTTLFLWGNLWEVNREWIYMDLCTIFAFLLGETLYLGCSEMMKSDVPHWRTCSVT